ncbi:MAG: EamA family transporter, partial [Alphaproteobacteria bacterium]
MNLAHIALAVGVTAVWGFGFVVSKEGVGLLPPLFFLGLRFALVALLMAAFVKPPRGQIRPTLLISFTFGLGHFGLFYIGLSLGVEASTSALLWLLQVPFAVLLAIVFLRDRPGWRGLLGIAVAVGGSVMMVGEPRIHANMWGVAAILASGLAWAVANIQIKRMGEVNAISLTTWIAVFAAPQVLILSFVLETGQVESLITIDWRGLGAIIYMSVGSTIFAYGGWYYLLRRYRVTQVTSFILLVPLVGVVSAVLVLGDPLTVPTIIGG